MWRLSVAGRYVLLGGSIVLAAGPAWAQVAVSSSVLPIYINRVYGFQAKLPRGVTYSRTEPPAPDHGFSVELTGTKKLWVDASYSDTMSIKDALRTQTEDCQVDEQHSARLGTARAMFAHFNCPANAYHEAYEERLVLTVRRDTTRAPVCYQVALRTTSHESDLDDVALFEKLLVGFQISGHKAAR